jgi:hypothetical protein
MTLYFTVIGLNGVSAFGDFGGSTSGIGGSTSGIGGSTMSDNNWSQ